MCHDQSPKTCFVSLMLQSLWICDIPASWKLKRPSEYNLLTQLVPAVRFTTNVRGRLKLSLTSLKRNSWFSSGSQKSPLALCQQRRDFFGFVRTVTRDTLQLCLGVGILELLVHSSTAGLLCSWYGKPLACGHLSAPATTVLPPCDTSWTGGGVHLPFT